MKKLIAFVAMLAACACAQAQFAFELTGQVAYIDDGDTVILHPGGQRVRLAEIDAPETEHGPTRPGQPYGQTARAALATIMPVGSQVTAKCYERDAHGRAVCRLFYQDIDISLEMVRLGHAHAYVEYTHDPRIVGAAEYARITQKGVWASGNAVYPQTWRRSCWDTSGAPLFCSANEPADSTTTPVVVAAANPLQQQVTPRTNRTERTGIPPQVLASLSQTLTTTLEWLKTIRMP